MRFTFTKALILSFLKNHTIAYGLEIIKASGIQTGSFYPSIRTLKENGFVADYREDIDESAMGRRSRVYYTITPKGAVYLAENLHRL